MQIFNIITNIFTVVGTIVGCAMFYFTLKSHQWLIEDRKRQIEEEIKKKSNYIFSIVAEYSLSTQLNEIILPPNIVKDISNYNIPKGIVDFINEDIEKEIHNEFILQTNNYRYLAQQIIQHYRNGTRLNDIDFKRLRSLFKTSNEIDLIYNEIVINNKKSAEKNLTM